MPGPIQPEELEEPEIPEKVYQVFNDLIERTWNGYEAKFVVWDVKSRLRTRDADNIFKGPLLVRLVVQTYREAGWVVEYELNPRSVRAGSSSRSEGIR